MSQRQHVAVHGYTCGSEPEADIPLSGEVELAPDGSFCWIDDEGIHCSEVHGDGDAARPPVFHQAAFEALRGESVGSVAVGLNHMLLVDRAGGRVWSLGNNAHGQAGLSPRQHAVLPAPRLVIASGAEDPDEGGRSAFEGPGPCQRIEHRVEAVAAGSDHSLLLAGHLLGPVELPRRAVSLACGASHSLVVLEDGSCWGFGCNLYGALGEELPREEARPHPVRGLEGLRIAQTACGTWSSAFLTDSGEVYVCGSRLLSCPASAPTRLELPESGPPRAAPRISQIAMGSRHLLCRSEAGAVLGLGLARQGQLPLAPEEAEEPGLAILPCLTPLDLRGVRSVRAAQWTSLFVLS